MRVAILHTAEAAGPPRDMVLDQLTVALGEAGHAVAEPIVVGSSVEDVVGQIREVDPELVFNVAESFDGKSALESNIAALLNLLGLRYTGSSPAGLILAGDKALTKKVLGFHEIRTPRFASVYRGALEAAGELAFPLIVKPPQEDASLGISELSVVHDVGELLRTMDRIHSEFRQPVLVEEFIDGREFYVGVLGNAHPQPLPPIELRFDSADRAAPRIASFDAKWAEAEGRQPRVRTSSVFPDDVAPELLTRMQDLAVRCFDALRLRDYARIDLRVTADDELYVLEANPNCYLEQGSEFALAAARAGMSYPRLIGAIVELAAARYAR
jgi:D-alanine-D-alanine ligase